MSKAKDLTGKRSGKLTILKMVGRDSNNKILWLCRCECGNMKEARSDQLSSTRIQSCGCLSEEIRRNGGWVGF